MVPVPARQKQHHRNQRGSVLVLQRPRQQTAVLLPRREGVYPLPRPGKPVFGFKPDPYVDGVYSEGRYGEGDYGG